MRVTALEKHVGFCAHNEEGRFQREAVQSLEGMRPGKYTVDWGWGGRLGYFALLAA